MVRGCCGDACNVCALDAVFYKTGDSGAERILDTRDYSRNNMEIFYMDI
jgi:hypothetical protein